MQRTWRLGLVVGLLAGAASPARPAGFALDTLEPPPPGDTFFSVPDAAAAPPRRPAMALTPAYASAPYGLYQDGVLVPDGMVVSDRLTLHAGAALPLGEAWVVDAALPLVVWQQGEAPLAGVDAVAPGVLGDLRLGARWAFLRREGLALALGAMAFLPTGDQDAYASDGALRLLPQLLASGEGAGLRWSASAGYLWREVVDAGATQAGAAVTYGGAVALRFAGGALQVGPELTGRWTVTGTPSHSLEGLVGARWRPGDLSLGLALGGRLTDQAPGAAAFRALLQLAWAPAPEAP